MLNSEDCKYVISEIRNRSYYSNLLKEFERKLEELEDELARSSGPFSPGAGTDVTMVGRDGVAYTVSVKIRGNGKTMEERILDVVEKKKPVERDRDFFRQLKQRADAYYSALVSDEEWSGFVRAFFDEEQYGSLSHKYAVANPYRQVCRIIAKNIKRV